MSQAKIQILDPVGNVPVGGHKLAPLLENVGGSRVGFRVQWPSFDIFMERIGELLRDLYVWAYERSTQEYQAIKQDLAEPDPLRLAWRDFIKQAIREVITQPELDPLTSIQRSVAERIPEHEQPAVQALLIEELRRLHEGVLARYGLRPSEFAAWKARRKLGKLGSKLGSDSN